METGKQSNDADETVLRQNLHALTEDEIRVLLHSPRGQQFLHYEVAAAVRKYIAVWSGVLGVGGVLGLLAIFSWVSSSVTELATEKAIVFNIEASGLVRLHHIEPRQTADNRSPQRTHSPPRPQ